jgi:hypothetical protein
VVSAKVVKKHKTTKMRKKAGRKNHSSRLKNIKNAL